MAGDWIKIEHSLPSKPEVMQLASLLGLEEMAVVGHLVLFWSWVDQNLSPECPVVSGTKSGLDRVAGRDGFATAMVAVGWLLFDGDKIEIPNYGHHLSTSAKKRAMDSRKKRNQRKSVPVLSPPASPECPDDVPLSAGQNGGLEKRREERVSKDTLYPAFEAWWNIYPRKKGKLAAKKAYEKAVIAIAKTKGVSIDTATEALLRATQERLPQDPNFEKQFQKYPASWLSAGCYDDEIEAPVSRVATKEDLKAWRPE